MKKVLIGFVIGAVLMVSGQVMAQEVPKDNIEIATKAEKIRGLIVYKEYLEEVVTYKKEAIEHITIDLAKKPEAEHLITGLSRNKKELAKFEVKLEKVNAELKELESSQ